MFSWVEITLMAIFTGKTRMIVTNLTTKLFSHNKHWPNLIPVRACSCRPMRGLCAQLWPITARASLPAPSLLDRNLRGCKAETLCIRVSKRDLFLDFEFAHWTDSVFWCKTKNISRIFHYGLVWGWTSPKNWTFLSFENIEAPCGWRCNVQTFLASLVMLVARQIQFLALF